MIRKKKLIAFIPVRAGSKGIPGKNLYLITGKTLIERTIDLAKSSPSIDLIVVSSENDKMLNIAKKSGAKTVKRPKELSNDFASTIDVIDHGISQIEEEDSYILLLQVTSPLRSKEDLKNAIAQFETNFSASSLVSITELSDPHPNKVQIINNGFVKSYLNVESMVPRQSLPTVYRLNGAFYIRKFNEIKEYRSFFSDSTMPFLLPEERGLNLDSMADIKYLEYLIQTKPELFHD